jgi:hypothetical protein
VVGQWVHDRREAVAALERARDSDASSAVRKKAGWYTPGGPIFLRTMPATSARPNR